MSEQEPKTKKDNMLFILGIIATILIVGAVLIYISLESPDVSEKIDQVFNFRGCGEGTFYHDSTNTCELYPEVRQADTNQDLKDEIDRVVRDIRLDVDGHRIVEMDENGIPVVSCNPFENDDFVISENCIMTFK